MERQPPPLPIPTTPEEAHWRAQTASLPHPCGCIGSQGWPTSACAEWARLDDAVSAAWQHYTDTKERADWLAYQEATKRYYAHFVVPSESEVSN